MKYKVIFDTNSIRNAKSVTDFLGGRDELKKFLKVSEIIIPEIVIEEIKNQKRKHLVSKRDSFLTNPFHFLRKIDEEGTKNFDIEKWILKLAGSEKVPHSVIKLTRKNVLEEIKALCVKNLPPFEENSDKGFRDVYIYFTILEYLDNCGSGSVFVVTKDARLRQAFEGNSRVTAVKDFDEFEKYIDTYFRKDYFISRLKEEIAENITSESIQEIWLNTEENWIIKLIVEDKCYFIEVDFSSREIIGFTDFDFSDGIKNLITSGSLSTTHANIEEIKDYIKYFSDAEILKLIQASTENQQIFWFATDNNVKEFFKKIFKDKSQIISDDLKIKFNQYFKSI